MIKHHCDVCGAEVARPRGALTTRSCEVGFGKPGDRDPRVGVTITVAVTGGPMDDGSKATCDACLRDAVIIALGLPPRLLSGPSPRNRQKEG